MSERPEPEDAGSDDDLFVPADLTELHQLLELADTEAEQ